jgi:hypothetical protein
MSEEHHLRMKGFAVHSRPRIRAYWAPNRDAHPAAERDAQQQVQAPIAEEN